MVHINFIRKKLSLPLKMFLVVCVIYIFLMTQKDFPPRWKSTENNDSKPSKRKNSTAEEILQGYFNLHRWDSLCGLSVDVLRDNFFFPKLPKWRSSVNILKLKTNSINFGQRIFGYIHPPSSGFYQFSISSDDSSELWLSSNDNPNNASLICHVGGQEKGKFVFGYTKPGEFNKYKNQTSQSIYLKKGGKYFMEILHKQEDGLAHFSVVWKVPGSEKLEDITSKYISAYMEEHALFTSSDVHVLKQHKAVHVLRQHKAVHVLRQHKARSKKFIGSFTNDKVRHAVRYAAHRALPKCTRSKVKTVLKRFQGISLVHTMSVYPPDGTNDIIQLCRNNHVKRNCWGNRVLSKESASRIVDQYLKSPLLKNHSLKYIVKIEEFKTKNSSIRQFFIDIETINQSNGEVARIAEQVWEKSDDKTLCSPREKSMNPDVMIYVIVTVKDQGFWLRHFVDTMVYIQEEAKDNNIHPIIVDFGSGDVGPNDTEIYLEKSKLKHYTVIHNSGSFYKTAAINEAAASVKDNNSILFQLDLHLDIPLNLMDTVRKHTIQGQLAFAPILLRLMCGSTPDFPTGFWEDAGYGLFAIYKSDWIEFGGMNVKEYGTKWGREDWEMLDRVLMNNIAVQQIKLPGLFHYYHGRNKLWENTA